MSDSGGSSDRRPSTAAGTRSLIPANYSRRQRVFLNDPAKNEPFYYPDNSIMTSRYTVLTFFPLFLKQQYQKASNIFLLVVCILTFIPGISALTPAASLFPVLFVLLVAGLKESYEDWKRHRADDAANSVEVRVLRRKKEETNNNNNNGNNNIEEKKTKKKSSSSEKQQLQGETDAHNVSGLTADADDQENDDDEEEEGGEEDDFEWVKVPSRDVQAGDITLYEHGDEIRADSIVLASSNDDGVAFIETANLDGETTLKIRRAPPICTKYLSSERGVMKVTKLHGVAVLAGEPNADLQKFRAAIHIGGRETQPALLEDEVQAQQLRAALKRGSGRTGRGDSLGGGSNRERSGSRKSEDGGGSSGGGSSVGGGSSNAGSGSGSGSGGGVAKLGVDIKCFLYRGSMLRNTEWALCATIYTGINTKMFLNLQQIAPRMSTLDQAVNRMIFCLLLLHQVAILLVAGMSVAWSQENSCNTSDGISTWYIRSKSVASCDIAAIFFLKYLSYFVLLSFILPASLFVTIEVAKAVQAVFMSWDLGMSTFHVASGEWMLCKPKTSTLNEQLGVVRYVFTDKTGTLTQNQMNVVRLCVGETQLGDDAGGQVSRAVARNVARVERQLIGGPSNININNNSSNGSSNSGNNNNNKSSLEESSSLSLLLASATTDPHHQLTDEQVLLIRQQEAARRQKEEFRLDQLNNQVELNQISASDLHDAEEAVLRGRQARALQLLERDMLHLLLLNMATCHSVVCFDSRTHPLLKTYEGPSQDELALAASARRNGYALMDRKANGVTVNLPGERMTLLFEVLAELEFTSERQMMSVLVKDAIHQAATVSETNPKGESRYILFSKGGDSAIFTKTALPHSTSSHHQQPQQQQQSSSLPPSSHPLLRHTDSANETLVFAAGAVAGAGSSGPSLVVDNKAINRQKQQQILAQLDDMCSQGLRTLVFAYRIITEHEKNHWLKKFEAAKCAIENRNELVTAAYSQIEHSLQLIGVVGIEDKLQDSVPETIHFFRQAGITIWILTGDKRETAVAIAETSRLINPLLDTVAHIDVVSLVEDDETSIDEVAEVCLEQMRQIVVAHLGNSSSSNKREGSDDGRNDPVAAAAAAVADDDKNCNLRQNKQQQQQVDDDRQLGFESDEYKEKMKKLLADHRAKIFLPGSSPSLKKRRVSTTSNINTNQNKDDDNNNNNNNSRHGHDVDATEAEAMAIAAATAASGTFEPQVNRVADDDDDDDDDDEAGKRRRRESPLVLVIDGVSLKTALHSNEGEFMYVALMAKSAVCCRLSPLLKATLVRLFQSCTSETVLAIGDGANDVSMIQESLVGVGIMGLEGSQAELSSAYAIPQFKDLKRLMVVHGRYAWYRTTTCMCYTVFKNAALTLCLFYFSFWSAFSGSTLYDSWLLTMFNTFFTQATPLLMGGIDTDVDDEILMECSELYGFIRTDKEYFNKRTFFFWSCDALCASGVIFFVGLSMMQADDMGRGDHVADPPHAISLSITGMSLDHYGTISFLVLLVLVDAHALVTQRLYSTFSGTIVFLNWCLIPCIMFLYGALPVDSSFTYTNIPDEVLSDRLFYLFMWVANAMVVVCLRVAARRLIRITWPSASEIAIKKRVEQFKQRKADEETARAEAAAAAAAAVAAESGDSEKRSGLS